MSHSVVYGVASFITLIRRNSYRRLAGTKISRKAVTLNRMSRSFDNSYEDRSVTSSTSQQDFIEMLSQVQGRRYDNQRSPYPSPTLMSKQDQDSVDYSMSNGEVHVEEDDDNSSTTTPTNNSQDNATALDVSITCTKDGSIHSSSSENSIVVSSPSHLNPVTSMPGSPCLKPNRRSVEALRTLLKQDEAPFPLIIEPPDGGYWVRNGEYHGSKGADGIWRAPEIDTEHFRVDTDNTALMYGYHFVGKPHKNFYANDKRLGPIIFSLMFDTASSYDAMIRMILRTQTETLYKVYPSAQLSRKLEPEEYLAIISSHLKDGESSRTEHLRRITVPNAQELIQKFDEHCVAKQHKVGVIYQKFGQATEEEMFCNNEHSPAFKEFLELLGETVTLKGFEKYRGGLDNCHNQTGERSVYTEFKGQEIMFHVSTLLPFDPSDRQQVARKRHIGNDIILVVFQDSNTPYSPDCVRSRFLHAHIVVQVEQPCTSDTVYKVAVAAKNQVPDFTPPLPTPAVFAKGLDFREWLLTKILNAESHCHKAPDFKRLAYRTRTQLFTHLMKDISADHDDVDSSLQVPDKRKSVTVGYDNFEANQSPRRRRMTFGSIFPKRKVSVTPSPKLSPRKVSTIERPAPIISGPNKKFTTSTPDLSRLTSDDDCITSSGTQTMDRKNQNKVKGQSKTRRFTIHGKSRKKSQQVTLPTIGGAAEDELPIHDNSFRQVVPPSSHHHSSLASSLNWSVPSDLPTVVTQQTSTTIPSGPTSLENLAITLEPSDSNLDRGRCASNPDIIDERRRSTRKVRPQIPAEFYSVSDIQRRPGSAGPQTCDVSIQVDTKQVFTFPTPPNSVSPTLPLEQLHSSPHHHALLLSHKRIPTANQHLDHIIQEDNNGGQHSSSNSLENRHSGGSFPFVPEENEEDMNEDGEQTDRQQHYEGGSSRKGAYSMSKNEVIEEEGGDESSPESSGSLDDTDTTYQSLMNNIHSLTLEVSKLQKNQIRLYKENTRMTLNARKWKDKFKQAKTELAKKDALISTLQEKLENSVRERKSSELGTTL